MEVMNRGVGHGGSTVSIGNAQAILQALIQRGASPQDTTTKATPKLFMDPQLISAVGLAWIYYCFFYPQPFWNL